MSEQTSTPDESYEGLDDSLSFSSSAVDDAAPQAAAAPEVEEASAETAEPALEAGGAAESPEAEGESAEDETSEAAGDETTEGAGDETTEEPAEDAEAAAEEPAEEDPLVQLKRHLRAAAGDWYVIHSYSGHENRVKTQLATRTETQDMEEYIFEVQVPMEDATEVKNGQKK
ncbi:MAG TPA: transcription termination/antitermination NusG family protein, partial [Brachybacterium sp.]|nr:transcription termination/antitermination NusG family protein [Brachybacterium sp.]